MPNNFKNVDVICPYFKSYDDKGRSISCEGINNRSTFVRINFEMRKHRDDFMTAHCNSFDYLSCPYAALCEAKYAQEE